MHVLPFVSIFLIILATISYSFLDKSKLAVYEKHMMLGRMKIERKLVRKLHREAFIKAPKKKTSSEQASSKPQQVAPIDPAITPRTTSISKLNLFPFLTQEVSPDLELVLKTLLLSLYENCPLKKEASFSQFLSKLSVDLLKKGKEKLEAYKTLKQDISSLHFSEFYPEDPLKHLFFYKILKGTHSYDLVSEGYPPLEDFFCLNSEEKTIFHFPSLSPLMLSAVFSFEGAKAILEKEQEIRSSYPDRLLKTLSKEELIELLHKQFPTQTFYDQLINFLDFSPHPFKKESLVIYDTTTQLQIEKKLF